MLNRTCLCFLIGMSICSTVASHEATVYPFHPPDQSIYHEPTRMSIDSLILRLGFKFSKNHEERHQEIISAIKEMNIPDTHLLLRWSQLTKLLKDGKLLNDYHIEVLAHKRRIEALFSLIDLDNALDGLLPIVKTGTTHLRFHALSVLDMIHYLLKESHLKPQPRTVRLIAGELRHPDAELSELAADILHFSIPPADARDAVPALLNALDHENQHVRLKNIATLGRIAAAHPDVQSEATDKLIAMLNDPPFIVYHHRGLYDTLHSTLKTALSSIGDSAVPSLLAALNSPNPAVRHHAALILPPTHAETTFPVLTEALSSHSFSTSSHAISALEAVALATPTLAPEIISLFRQMFRPEHTAPLTADDLPPVDAAVDAIMDAEWDPTFNWDSIDLRSHQRRFHQLLKHALDQLTQDD